MDYIKFLKSKEERFIDAGFDVDRNNLNSNLFEYQKDVVVWALRKGRAALFEDCGLGKTIQQLEWANQVSKYTGGKVLILCPLAIAKQTAREGKKFGIEVNVCRSSKDVKDGINITNYDMLHKFDLDEFKGVVLDESSILKSFTGKMRNEIIEGFKNTPYRLACTATPSPNDFMELGNHSEFLGVMTRTEMLSMYFIHDGGDTSKWRLKGHAEDKFWEWVTTWAVMIDNPSNLGYDIKFELPELNVQDIVLKTHEETDTLVPTVALTLNERREARRNSLEDRLSKAKELVKDTNEQFLIWCDFNYESEILKKELKGIEVKGSDTPEHKESSMLGFSDGDIKILITKPSIAGFGMNWQQCHNIIFFGLSDSYEQFYQAVRRCWRFGQKEKVNVYVIIGEREVAVLNNIKRKQENLETMKENMIKHSKDIKNLNVKEVKKTNRYLPQHEMKLPVWI
ncbi:DEAD/DEAH box helicase [Clostridium cadaveris]|uniref:helicase-related protein n=1 Tax=Clostridium cadaveris TaxID=1529 RepID=UPI0004125BF5|nr:DEAD/DEAH box helicase [Clostridium cadaveris]MDM8313634.1 DEAD/DEAH box helicase [Clostridium cadaveris]